MMKNDNLKNMDFDWEIPVDSVPLPSKGKIYSKDSWFSNKEFIDIKAMTATEEDILMSSAFIKKGTVIEELIKSCVMEKNIDIDDLIAGDRNAILVAIRITGYGKDYNTNITCGNCQGVNENYSFDLSELPIKRLTIEPCEEGKNIFEYILPVSKKKVKFRLLSGRDEKEMQDENLKKVKLFGENYIGNITANLEKMIVDIDGVTHRGKIANFISMMPAFDSRSLRKYISDSQPGIDTKVDFCCQHCGNKKKIDMPINTDFFWPSI